MLNSQSLEVAVGLVLIFLLFSLVLTAFREAVEGILKARARNLERALAELFDDRAGDGLRKLFYEHPLVSGLFPGQPKLTAFADNGKPAGALLDRAVKAVKERTNLPSYIPREVFSTVIDDLITANAQPSQKFDAAYQALVRISGGNPAGTKVALEQWFDSAMDRASGWYKRRSQLIVGVTGVVLAMVLNVNAVTVAQHLATNEAARAQAVKFAENAPLPAGVPDPKIQLEDFRTQAAALELPIGWSASERAKFSATLDADGFLPKLGEFTLLLAGFLIVGLAGMLGAPFWFDILGKIMVIRSTVKPKEKSPDEASKDTGTGGKPAPSTTAAAPQTAMSSGGTQEGEPGLVVYG
jgi:hypothetical protein